MCAKYSTSKLNLKWSQVARAPQVTGRSKDQSFMKELTSVHIDNDGQMPLVVSVY